MKPDFEISGVELYRGDCRSVMAALPAESVQCVVLYADTIETLGTQKCGFTPAHKLIRKTFVGDTARRAIGVGEVAPANDFRPMFRRFFFEQGQTQNHISNRRLDPKKWTNRLNNGFGPAVGGLVAEQGAAIVAMRLFFVIPTAKRFGEKANGMFINHPNLNCRMVSWGNTALAAVWLALFDANAALAVDKARKVCEIGSFHNRVPYGGLVIIRERTQNVNRNPAR